jgi:hypothetical protein
MHCELPFGLSLDMQPNESIRLSFWMPVGYMFQLRSQISFDEFFKFITYSG